MLTIKNFGHYWSRDLIEWGTPGKGNQGRLMGSLSPNSTKGMADFRDQVGIYVLFGPAREIVYIGQSGRGDQRLFSRLRKHSRGPMRDRWTNFSWFGFLSVGENGALQEAEDPQAAITGSHVAALNETESVLLQIIEPPLNKQGPRWSGVEEYFQYSGYEPTTLDDLWEQLRAIKEKLAIEE